MVTGQQVCLALMKNRDKIQDMGYGVIKVDQSLASVVWVFYSCVGKAESTKSIRDLEFVV